MLIGKIIEEGVIDQEQWIESAEQKPLRSVGEDLAFPGGGTLPPFGWREKSEKRR